MALTRLGADTMPPEELWLAAVIQVTDCARQQLHTGLLFRRESGELRYGHLAWHLRLFDSELPLQQAAYWVEPTLTRDTQRVLASRLTTILELNAGKIPYSIEHEGLLTYEGQVWTDDRPGQGMTCSTFVRSVFDEVGVPFVDISTWQERDGDVQWRAAILELMRDFDVPEAHISAQADRLGLTVRLRPEDVPAAFELMKAESLTFDEVAPRAQEIRAELLAPCSEANSDAAA